MKHIIIIGGGMAGLSAAYELQKAIDQGVDLRYSLLERESRLGGKVHTEQLGNSVVEAGPDSYIAQKPWATDLVRELGLEDQLIPSRDYLQKVCVVHRRRLVPFPAGLRLAIPTEWLPFLCTRLISPLGKLRMGCERFIPAYQGNEDESLGTFIQRRLGREALRKLAGPMMAGIYSGDPDRLSILSTFPMFRDMEKKYGSLVQGMVHARRHAPPKKGKPGGTFLSLRDGMRTLPLAIQERLKGDVRCDCEVTAIRRHGDGYQVESTSGEPIDSDHILFATPAYIAADLLRELLPEAADRLDDIRYLSTATVAMRFDRDGFNAIQDGVGRGFVVPLHEQKTITACTMSSCKFAYRTQDDSVLLRAFVGGPINSESSTLPDDELVALVKAELKELLDIDQEPNLVRIHRWLRGNPQYDVGHLDRMDELDALLDRELPGVRITGSACRGVGIPDVVRQGRGAANTILSSLDSDSG